MKVRNPWGNDAEWTGDWSDDSEPWLFKGEISLEISRKVQEMTHLVPLNFS